MKSLQQLIEDCARNDRLGQKELYLKFYAGLFLLCKRFFADDHEALETLNDGMLKVFKHIATFKGNSTDFFNWSYTIVRNTALDKLKLLKHPTHEAVTAHHEYSVYENPLKALEGKDTYRFLDKLTPATRAVCSLFYLEGFSIAEISLQLKISPGTVKWHLSETRQKLKPVLKNYFS